jgi:hypothetical protein
MEKTPTVTILTLALLTGPALAGGVPTGSEAESLWLPFDEVRSPDPVEEGGFGETVAYADGILLVGAPAERTVYVFEEGPSGWTHATTLSVDEVTVRDRFGASLAFDGTTAAVGAPGASTVYAFERDLDRWSEPVTLDDGSVSFTGFGWSLALEGDRLVIGAPHASVDGVDKAGSIHVYDTTQGGWSEEHTISTPARSSSLLGWSVDTSGAKIAAGAMGSASVEVYQQASGSWSHVQSLTSEAAWDGYGREVALQGQTLAVGAPFASSESGFDSGAVYLYDERGSSWTQATVLWPQDVKPLETNAGFGTSLAITGDEGQLLVGAPEDDPSPGDPGATPASQDPVCVSLAISPTCQRPGAAYLFSSDEGAWEQTQKLTAPDASPAALRQVSAPGGFGSSVAIDGDTLAVGAPLADGVPGDESGSSWIFQHIGGVGS